VPRAAATPVAPLAPAESYRRTGLVLPTVVGALASACGVALTATSGWLIVQASTRPAVLTLMVAIVCVRTFGLARPLLRYLERLLSHDTVLGMLARRRADVYDALVPLTPGRLGPRRGDVLASVVDDVDSVLDRELRGRMPLRGLVLVALLSGTVAAFLDVGAGVVVLGGVAVGLAAHALVRRATTRTEEQMVAARAALSECVVETIQVADELVMWQATERAVDRVANASDAVATGTVRSARWLALGRALALAGSGLAVALVALVVAPEVAHGGLSGPLAGLLVLLPLALAEVVVPVVDAAVATARARAAEVRLDALLGLGPAVSDPPRPHPAPEVLDVEVRAVTAAWEERTVLDGLSLSVPAGRRISVVGPSGSGKSTLAALLLRFLDPDAGTLRLGGVDLPCLALDDVRRLVGLVDDDPHVFATTLAENIRLARPGAEDAAVVDALHRAGLGAWLDGLEEGLDTRLGDGFAEVSGGERARLAVARSLLADQQVLVLDEPTAHLDHATAEVLAHEVLAPCDRAVVWITHEPVGLEHLDQLIHLDRPGEVSNPRDQDGARHTP
jgi:ATP-binding cassette, subfamily C, bacterial CydCD